MSYSHEELLKCCERELALRRAVYPRRVADGKMDAARATRETDMMAAVVDLLAELAGKRKSRAV